MDWTPPFVIRMKSWNHARWTTALVHAHEQLGLSWGLAAGLWKQTSFPRVLYRMAGSHVGRHVSFHVDYPTMPEMSRLSFGDCVFLSPVRPNGVYAHNISKGYFVFEPTTIDAGVHVGTQVQISCGVRLPEGVTVGPQSVVQRLNQLAPCAIVQGHLLQNVALDEGNFVAPGSGVSSWQPREWPALGEGCVETADMKAEKGIASGGDDDVKCGDTSGGLWLGALIWAIGIATVVGLYYGICVLLMQSMDTTDTPQQLVATDSIMVLPSNASNFSLPTVREWELKDSVGSSNDSFDFEAPRQSLIAAGVGYAAALVPPGIADISQSAARRVSRGWIKSMNLGHHASVVRQKLHGSLQPREPS